MQHGRKKPTTPLSHALKVLEQKKITEYRAKATQCLELRRRHVLTADALAATAALLGDNTEYYTIWNYRRELLAVVPDDKVAALQQELVWLTRTILPCNPKSYWIWNHRRWTLETLAGILVAKQDAIVALWRGEMKLVDRFLDLDPRNFHAWDYRRYVVAQLRPYDARLAEAEFQFTSTKVAQNFSNFSAWHQRSKLFAEWLQQTNRAFPDALNDELELLHNAVYTEPNDQSAWLYHKWLLAQAVDRLDASALAAVRRAELAVIEELVELEPECKWVLGALVFLYTLGGSAMPDEIRKAEYMVAELKRIDPYRAQYYATLVPPRQEGGGKAAKAEPDSGSRVTARS
ncbi:Rab geranylgeranyltransferase [Allomyces javanicus]|nr:Rab geranylgeranyltransferase [Allomyces javanicus]